jgi:Mg-chelatase subunit ChlD
MAFDSRAQEEAEELSGKLGFTEIGQGLMHSVIEGKQTNEGKLIKESINQGLGSFVPDDIYQNLVQNYSMAENIYGKTFVNLISGYDADYVGKNIKIPEFQRQLKQKIAEKIKELHSQGLLEEQKLTEKAIQLASLVLYIEELDNLVSHNIFGEQTSKKRTTYGSKGETHNFTKKDRYRDLAIKRSIKKAIRRQHTTLTSQDLEAHERQSHGSINIIYGIDASGSMKGDKIDTAKKAGIALAFKAIERKDKVGLVVFSKEVKNSIAPTTDFGLLLKVITNIRAARQTNMTALLQKATELFPRNNSTNHLIILTDALPTIGSQPEEETLKAAATANAYNITISVAGINLDKKGTKLAQKIAELGQGRFYLIKNIKELDKIILEDYYSL